jgi:hypothetical protein
LGGERHTSTARRQGGNAADEDDSLKNFACYFPILFLDLSLQLPLCEVGTETALPPAPITIIIITTSVTATTTTTTYTTTTIIIMIIVIVPH